MPKQKKPEPRYVGTVHLFVYPSETVPGKEYACIVTRGTTAAERAANPLSALVRAAWCSCEGFGHRRECWHAGDAWSRAEAMEAPGGGLVLLPGGAVDSAPEPDEPPRGVFA